IAILLYYATHPALHSFPTRRSSDLDTTLPLAELQMLAEKLTTIPANFKIHPRVEKIIADRRLMGQGKMPVDWGMAENLAYASLQDRKSTRLNSSHVSISYAVFCLKK